ncbi:MAG: peptidase [Alphaproteobacteria bacterium]
MPKKLIQPEPWEGQECWLARQKPQRSYKELVIDRITALDAQYFGVQQYGALSIDPDRYPLFGIKVGKWDDNKPTFLLTGGVHGYETSGLIGNLQFLENHALDYSEHFNIVALPGISPWSFETINRLNPLLFNPNREFRHDSTCEESTLAMAFIDSLQGPIDAHMDLHETPESDRTIFRPEQASIDGTTYEDTPKPDGSYLITPETLRMEQLERAIVASMKKILPIASPDNDGNINSLKMQHEGVIRYPAGKGVCMDYTNAASRLGAFTTEIYPDGEHTTEQDCNDGQVAAIRGFLDHILDIS